MAKFYSSILNSRYPSVVRGHLWLIKIGLWMSSYMWIQVAPAMPSDVAQH